MNYRILYILLALMLLPLSAMAQRENAGIRSGNSYYRDGKFNDAVKEYTGSLIINEKAYKAGYNLGNALFGLESYDKAIEQWQSTLESGEELPVDAQKQLHFNIGNGYLASRHENPQAIDAAIESFKNALRLDPSDEIARYNLAYAQALKQDDDGGGEGEDNQDQNQNQDQDQQGDKEQKQDQNQDQNDNQNQDKNQDKQDQQQQQKPQSRSDAERMADAIQRAEDATKEKVDKENAEEAVVMGNGKNW